MPYVPYSVWPNVCTQIAHLAAIKHYKSPIASLIYERPLVGSFKVYHALLGLISFTRYVDDTKPKMQLDVCCLSGSGLFLGRSEPWGGISAKVGVIELGSALLAKAATCH